MDVWGATVADLELPPPGFIYADSAIADARDTMFEILPWAQPIIPVFSRITRRVEGYLISQRLQYELEIGEWQAVSQHMMRISPPSVPVYTRVDELATLLRAHPLVEILDAPRQRLLAVATAFDLERRGIKIYKECT